jgi:hypothetical protein
MTFRPRLCLRIDEETELRIYEERYAQEVAEPVNQNREYLRQCLPWAENSRSVDEGKAFIRNSLQQFVQNEGLQTGRDIARRTMVERSLYRHGYLWFVDQKVADEYVKLLISSEYCLRYNDYIEVPN